jgi:hypothetical protein
MIDIACLAVVAVVAWCVASEGIHGAAQTLLCTLIAALLAMNFFEPLASMLDGALGGWRKYSDIIALVGLFIAFIFALRLGIEQLAPTYIQLQPTLDQFGRWAFAALTGYLTMAFLLTALHTAPLPREFMQFKPERGNFFGMFPDRQWLGFVQYVTEKPFGWREYQIPNTSPPQFVMHAFDGQYMRLGDPSNPYPNTIWPSFVIRYASRRAQIAGGSGGAAAPAPIPVQQMNAPTGGNNAAGPGF